MTRARRLSFALALTALLSSSCGSKDPPTGLIFVSPSEDAGVADSGFGAVEASGGCVGACRETSLVVTFEGTSKPLTRAQFGFIGGDGGSALLHLEAHDGGSSACPTTSSPQTDRTLVIEDLPQPTGTTALGTSDGVRAAFFDFEGTLLPTTPLAKANTVELRPTVVERDASGTLRAVAFDVDMTFPQGMTLKGRLFAEHCASMD